jgi:hypothetical protein
MVRIQLAVLAVVFICSTTAKATNGDPTFAPCPTDVQLSEAEVVGRLAAHDAERTRELVSFQGSRQYNLKYSGLPYPQSAEMHIKVSYAAPGTKQFTIVSESGSKLILDKVLHRLLASEKEAASDQANRDTVALNVHNYTFSLLGCEAANGHQQYVMHAEPLRADKYLYRGTVWIDSHDFAVTHIEAEPAKNPSFWTKRTQIIHRYEKVGPFYLPQFNQSVTDVRLGGTAVLTIRYQDYKLPQLAATKGTAVSTQ